MFLDHAFKTVAFKPTQEMACAFLPSFSTPTSFKQSLTS